MKDKGVELVFRAHESRQAMSQQEEEKYIHFENSIESLNNARRILNEIKRQKGNVLAGYAFQFALIEYSKPYKGSNSAIRNSKGKPAHKYKLGIEYIPQKHLPLHKRILEARDKFHVHTDLDIRDTKVYKHEKYIGRSQNIIDGTEEMKNIDDIIDLIEQTLDAMYVEVKRLGDTLPTNL